MGAWFALSCFEILANKEVKNIMSFLRRFGMIRDKKMEAILATLTILDPLHIFRYISYSRLKKKEKKATLQENARKRRCTLCWKKRERWMGIPLKKKKTGRRTSWCWEFISILMFTSGWRRSLELRIPPQRVTTLFNPCYICVNMRFRLVESLYKINHLGLVSIFQVSFLDRYSSTRAP